jgi:hypothetical protein
MRRGLLQDDFEDGVAVGDVQESVSAEHETQQAATPTVVGDAGHAGQVRSVPLRTMRRILPLLKSAKKRLSLSFMATLLVPPPLSVQALRMSASPARTRDRTLTLRATKVISLPVKTGGHSTNPPVQ